MESRSLWDRIWKDKTGRVVIWQTPSPLLIGWAVLTVISLFLHRGPIADGIAWLSIAVLSIWSILEIFKGVNYFRRALGVLVIPLIALLISSNL